LAKFIANECPVMFATDVAARGLDIKGVTHVINFDMARDVESYVHRIGRTGRAGELGASVTFWNPDYDKPCAPALVKIAKQAGQPVPPWLEKFEKVKTSKQWKTDKADKAVLALQTK
jgi:superfamily II DNA/RNA helicase